MEVENLFASVFALHTYTISIYPNVADAGCRHVHEGFDG